MARRGRRNSRKEVEDLRGIDQSRGGTITESAQRLAASILAAPAGIPDLQPTFNLATATNVPAWLMRDGQTTFFSSRGDYAATITPPITWNEYANDPVSNSLADQFLPALRAVLQSRSATTSVPLANNLVGYFRLVEWCVNAVMTVVTLNAAWHYFRDRDDGMGAGACPNGLQEAITIWHADDFGLQTYWRRWFERLSIHTLPPGVLAFIVETKQLFHVDERDQTLRMFVHSASNVTDETSLASAITTPLTTYLDYLDQDFSFEANFLTNFLRGWRVGDLRGAVAPAAEPMDILLAQMWWNSPLVTRTTAFNTTATSMYSFEGVTMKRAGFVDGFGTPNVYNVLPQESVAAFAGDLTVYELLHVPVFRYYNFTTVGEYLQVTPVNNGIITLVEDDGTISYISPLPFDDNTLVAGDLLIHPYESVVACRFMSYIDPASTTTQRQNGVRRWDMLPVTVYDDTSYEQLYAGVAQVLNTGLLTGIAVATDGNDIRLPPRANVETIG